MTMVYGLRVDHHATDHGHLILDGIRPALRAIGWREGGIGATLRPHWLDGPHLLIGLDIPSDDASERWAVLADAVQRWLDDEPPRPPLDEDAFRARAQKLAELEDLPYAPGPLRPDKHIERGHFAIPYPLGRMALAPLRDAFKAATLEDVFALVELRLRSPSEALVELAFRFVCLERLAWRDGLNFWPLSLQGQAHASSKAFSSIAKTFPERLAVLQPALLARARQEGMLDGALAASAHSRAWISRLQIAYERLLQFLDTAEPDFVRNVNAQAMAPFKAGMVAMNSIDTQTIAAMDHPTQFAYRMLMNSLYDMFPAIGFGASQRFLVCHLVTDMLEAHFPGILSRSYAHGAALCR